MPIMRDGKLFIEPNKWLVPIEQEYPALEKEYQRLVRTNEKVRYQG